MKVELTITLELPEKFRDFSRAELSQLLFDDYVNYVTCQHGSDALKWCADGHVGHPDEDPAAKIIFQHHSMWMGIASKAAFSFKIEGEKA